MAFDLLSIPPRELAPGQRCRVWIQSTTEDAPRLVYDADDLLLEAPNWLPSGDLLLNGGGGLHRLTPGGELTRVPLAGIPNLNNDHVLSPDRTEIFLSANDGQIYRAPVDGGEPERVTSAPPAGLLHFLHGVHPSGDPLAFVGVTTEGPGSWTGIIRTVSVDGGDYRELLSGPGSSDGCEYSPDGEWLYVNTEAFDGHAQIGRMRPDGSGLEQLTTDERVNWFPHVSPDGAWIVYLSYPPSTEGHPADLDVELRLVRDGDWSAPRTVARLFGGQGTINVNSWAPDSSAFAYVSYPV